MRPDTTIEGLAKLPTAFSKDGSVTAGNASGIVDGARGARARVAKQAVSAGPEADGAARLTGRRLVSTRRSWAWARRRRPARRSSAPA